MTEYIDGFTVQWSETNGLAGKCLEVSFEVWGVAATDADEDVKRYYTRKEAKDGTDLVESVADAEVYAHGCIKWDGCSHVYFNEYLHMCGRGCWQAHIDLMAYLWRRAGELMPDTPWDEFKPLAPQAATEQPPADGQQQERRDDG